MQVNWQPISKLSTEGCQEIYNISLMKFIDSQLKCCIIFYHKPFLSAAAVDLMLEASGTCRVSINSCCSSCWTGKSYFSGMMPLLHLIESWLNWLNLVCWSCSFSNHGDDFFCLDSDSNRPCAAVSCFSSWHRASMFELLCTSPFTNSSRLSILFFNSSVAVARVPVKQDFTNSTSPVRPTGSTWSLVNRFSGCYVALHKMNTLPDWASDWAVWTTAAEHVYAHIAGLANELPSRYLRAWWGQMIHFEASFGIGGSNDPLNLFVSCWNQLCWQRLTFLVPFLKVPFPVGYLSFCELCQPIKTLIPNILHEVNKASVNPLVDFPSQVQAFKNPVKRFNNHVCIDA